VSRAAFTTAEIKRFAAACKAVGERLGAVEKRPDGSVRILTANDLNASPDDAEEMERRMVEAFGR
jgi:hypothetical protein